MFRGSIDIVTQRIHLEDGREVIWVLLLEERTHSGPSSTEFAVDAGKFVEALSSRAPYIDKEDLLVIYGRTGIDKKMFHMQASTGLLWELLSNEDIDKMLV